MRRLGRAIRATAAVAGLAAAGVALVVAGLSPQPPEPAPVPEPFVIAADQLPPAEPAPAAVGVPNRLTIESLGVDAPLLPGEVSGLSLRLPSDPALLTLHTDGGQPCGDQGTVLIAGHVSSYGTKGVLWPLHAIKPGATAHVTCADGTLTTWQATGVRLERKADLPQNVFDAAGDRRLVIVTCGGPVMADGHYRDNVIATFTETTARGQQAAD